MDLTKWQTQLRKGLLDIVILNLLQQGRCHGYEMVQVLKRINGLAIREGNIYPVLARLQGDGLVESHTEQSQDGPPRRCYTLTDHGRENLSKMNGHWEQMVDSLDQIRKASQA